MSPIPKPEPTTKGVITDKRELHKRVNEAVGTRRAIADDAGQDREWDRQRRIERELLERLLANGLLGGEAKRTAEWTLHVLDVERERESW